MSEFDYLDIEKTAAIFNGVRFKIVQRNQGISILWRCLSCDKITITSLNDQVIRQSLNKKHVFLQFFEFLMRY